MHFFRVTGGRTWLRVEGVLPETSRRPRHAERPKYRAKVTINNRYTFEINYSSVTGITSSWTYSMHFKTTKASGLIIIPGLKPKVGVPGCRNTSLGLPVVEPDYVEGILPATPRRPRQEEWPSIQDKSQRYTVPTTYESCQWHLLAMTMLEVSCLLPGTSRWPRQRWWPLLQGYYCTKKRYTNGVWAIYRYTTADIGTLLWGCWCWNLTMSKAFCLQLRDDQGKAGWLYLQR